MGTTSTLGDVLSGNKPIKIEIGVNTTQAVIIGIVLLVAGTLIGIIIKKS